MRLTDILTLPRIKTPLESTTKADLIRELVDLLAATGALNDRDRVLQAVLERESTRTTGIGGGLAVPHGKCSAVGDLVMALGKPARPVDFESVDGRPVNLAILLVSPVDRTGPHIQALACIARLMSQDAFRAKLNAATTAQQLYDLIKQQDDAGA
jgi:mannitol/fructose-specific phosphotransferase system IIA component (Ntr-type)